MKEPVHLAFLGCGFATRIHSKTLSGFKSDVRCYYASRDPEKAESYHSKFNGAGVFDSYTDAIKSDAIDVVLVATPPVNHLELALQALATGKHVIVEKPPFLKSADFKTIRENAQKSGRRVFIAENYFYKPLALHLRELLKSGIIGEIMFVHVNALKMQKIDDWRGDTAVSGGGALFEGGIHWINFITNLGLTLKRVEGFRPAPKRGFEKSLLLAVEYDEGSVGTLYHSWETPSLFKGLRISKIYGREGSITFESNGIFILVRGRQKKIIFPGLSDIAGYKGMFRDFITSIKTGKEPAFNLDLAERDLKVIEQIYASINS